MSDVITTRDGKRFSVRFHWYTRSGWQAGYGPWSLTIYYWWPGKPAYSEGTSQADEA